MKAYVNRLRFLNCHLSLLGQALKDVDSVLKMGSDQPEVNKLCIKKLLKNNQNYILLEKRGIMCFVTSFKVYYMKVVKVACFNVGYVSTISFINLSKLT